MVGAELTTVRLNYYAMAVAINTKGTIELAFEKLQSEHPDQVHGRHMLTPEDSDDMKKFYEEGMWLKDIAEIYDIHVSAVHRRIKPRKKRAG